MRRIWSGVLGVLVLVLAACAPHSGGLPITYRVTHDGPVAMPGLTLEASLDRAAFQPGEAIVLHVVAVNDWAKDMVISDDPIFLVVTDAAGRPVPKTEAGLQHYPDIDESVMFTPRVRRLKPGRNPFEFPLSDYFALRGSGPFVVSAYVRISDVQHEAISNVVAFTVRAE